MTARPDEQSSLSVGEVADLSGVAPSAVRFYERHGLLRATRTSGNARRFALDAPCRIKVARVAQRVGLTVREIVEVFDSLPDTIGPDDWARVATTLVSEAERRIQRLRATLDDLGSGGRLCELEPDPGG